MPEIPEIDVADARTLHASGSATFLDIRDPQTHAQGAIEGAVHLDSQEAFDSFVAETPKDQKVVVYCYHGNSSRMVTSILQEAGFTDVQSMREGFEGWATGS